MRKTKIVCTLGPSTDDYKVLKELARSGMNVARLNLSHGTHAEHRARMDAIRRVRKELGVPLAILLDTKGPEIRVKTFKDGSVDLKKGKLFTLTTREVEGNETEVSVSYELLPGCVSEGDVILLNDGMIELCVDKVNGADIVCKVVHGGVLSNRKSINLPGREIDMPYLSDADRDDLRFAVEEDVDYIALSFVRTSDDVRQAKNFISMCGGDNIQIISKIENRQGVDNAREILELSDGIMVARGDMGVEIPFEELPNIQKTLIKNCYKIGKKVITATQMLESMISSPRPTRAEISDVANAIYDGTSAIMLSGETAAGKFPVEAVRTMAKIAEKTESCINFKKRFQAHEYTIKSITDAVSQATCASAFDLNAKAIITVSQSGYTARKVSRFRPECVIIAATTSEKVYNQLALNWGVLPTMALVQKTPDALFSHAAKCALNTGAVHEGDLAVLTGSSEVGKAGNSNTMRIEYLHY